MQQQQQTIDRSTQTAQASKSSGGVSPSHASERRAKRAVDAQTTRHKLLIETDSNGDAVVLWIQSLDSRSLPLEQRTSSGAKDSRGCLASRVHKATREEGRREECSRCCGGDCSHSRIASLHSFPANDAGASCEFARGMSEGERECLPRKERRERDSHPPDEGRSRRASRVFMTQKPIQLENASPSIAAASLLLC